MSNNLKKFVCPRFTRTIDPVLMARLFERHRDLLGDFDLQALRGDADGARGALEAFFAGPEERCPDGLVADLHRVADLGTAHGLRIMLDQSRRMGIALPPERSPDGDERRHAGGPLHSPGHCPAPVAVARSGSISSGVRARAGARSRPPIRVDWSNLKRTVR